MTNALEHGRQAFEKRAWTEAISFLTQADEASRLQLDDLERLAVAAHMSGKDRDSDDVLARAHRECVESGEPARAARCAFWLAFSLMGRGEISRAGGWLARARRLLDDGDLDCVERGYLLVPEGLQMIDTGDATGALAILDRAAELGARFRDAELITLAGLARGLALIRLGETAHGMALLDEVMVAVTADEVAPPVVGLAYCAVIAACHETFDLRRAQEWTAALSRWTESQPELVPYRGQCLVHRAEIMQLHGAWPAAMDEAERARDWLSKPPGQPAVADALYQKAELHRLRGEFTKAEEAYRQANQWGLSPEPGLAKLRLARGHVDAADAAIRRVLGEADQGMLRARVLSAFVDIVLAADDVPAARAAADELAAIAADLDAPLLRAASAQATGAVLIAEGNARLALTSLRRAWAAWRALEVPYEAARVRVLVGIACRELGDEDTAEMEFDAARLVFQQLGAATDIAGVEELLRKSVPKAAGGLTAREMQVLSLVARGKTNRAIAAELVISEKTVARHMSNIFVKLGLSSRSAATAYAYEHDLVS